jgi:hypothetical protein
VKVARSRHQEWSGRKWVVKMMGWLAVRAVVRVVSQAYNGSEAISKYLRSSTSGFTEAVADLPGALAPHLE